MTVPTCWPRTTARRVKQRRVAARNIASVDRKTFVGSPMVFPTRTRLAFIPYQANGPKEKQANRSRPVCSTRREPAWVLFGTHDLDNVSHTDDCPPTAKAHLRVRLLGSIKVTSWRLLMDQFSPVSTTISRPETSHVYFCAPCLWISMHLAFPHRIPRYSVPVRKNTSSRGRSSAEYSVITALRYAFCLARRIGHGTKDMFCAVMLGTPRRHAPDIRFSMVTSRTKVAPPLIAIFSISALPRRNGFCIGFRVHREGKRV